MGGLSWFAIPWLAATTMGLSALALESNPVFPTYALPETEIMSAIVPNRILGSLTECQTMMLQLV